jgi:DNA-binding GntR family transcriptional regulator
VEPARDTTIQRFSVVDNVTVLLRRALLAGEIGPGERINVAELERSFGVSHIPIREAVRRLETEGLIVATPQRAAVAAGVDLDDLSGLYDLRRIVECEVIRRSVETMTPAQVEVAREALAALEDEAEDHDSPRFWELHRDFHWSLLEPGANAWIQRVVERLWLASQRYVSLFVSETVDDAMADHRRLLVCCEQRDGRLAGDVLRRHLDRTELAVRQAFTARDEPDGEG